MAASLSKPPYLLCRCNITISPGRAFNRQRCRCQALQESRLQPDLSRRTLVPLLALVVSSQPGVRMYPVWVDFSALCSQLGKWRAWQQSVLFVSIPFQTAGPPILKPGNLSPVGLAWAGGLQDLVRGSARPELDPEQAVLMLLDARGTLYELKVCACLFSPKSNFAWH